ncbi:hypothetical protein [Aliikangiella sp. G2MR2-5]|uniref:hypothetical protein n=1 Tax=Aliikangiella sp. G2MR2-5 TaxID=2788943 RepID=UPI0018ABFF49|nr:hypothetical protein [Aliikangiella sp. G2MR2-5]
MNDVRLSAPPPPIVGFANTISADNSSLSEGSHQNLESRSNGLGNDGINHSANNEIEYRNTGSANVGSSQMNNQKNVSQPVRARALAEEVEQQQVPKVKKQATDTIAAKAGAMVNELDFPGFVSSLVNGTFDAVVDASIRQLESYSDLVAAISKSVDQFTAENVTDNQARDWLAQKYTGDVSLVLPSTPGSGQPQLFPKSDGLSPDWLADFDMQGEELTSEILERELLPRVRNKVGAERQQLLASMVMLGINRIAVKDGSITAKVMFRANAQDTAKVDYATGSDPQQALTQDWGQRGSRTYNQASTMVSTLAVNAQNESSVRADLFGEVKLNFVSEALPIDQLTGAETIALIQGLTPAISRQNLTQQNAPQNSQSINQQPSIVNGGQN